ncbi:MAG: O-antigen/teichoic acid export membrane protein [Nitrospinales bacterium]|jgi:O-antigen/teichoic acid export membrane protein
MLAQLLPLLAAPLLARLYTPEDFGALALFSAAVSLLLAFSSWRFDWSVPNTSSKTLAAVLLLFGIVALLFFSVATFFVLWNWAEQWTFWKGFDVLGPLLLFLPVIILGGGLHELMHCWYVRQAELSKVASVRITQSFTGTGLNIVGGYTGLGAWGLIGSSVISVWVGMGLLVSGAQNLKRSFARLSLNRIKVGIARYWWESTSSTMVAVVNVASLAAIPLLLVQYYSAKEVGWYALMYRLAITPIGLLTSALSQSFWAEAAQLVKTDIVKLKSLFLKSTKLLILAAIPVVLLCVSGPLFVGPVLGEAQWAGAGDILMALAPMLVGMIIVQPLTHLIVHKKQIWKFYLDAIKLVVTILLIILFSKAGGELHVLIFYLSLVFLVSYGILFYLNLICLKK